MYFELLSLNWGLFQSAMVLLLLGAAWYAKMLPPKCIHLSTDQGSQSSATSGDLSKMRLFTGIRIGHRGLSNDDGAMQETDRVACQTCRQENSDQTLHQYLMQLIAIATVLLML